MALTQEEADKIERCKRAHERRWGASCLPLASKRITPEEFESFLKDGDTIGLPAKRQSGQIVMITDKESGSRTFWDISGWRIRRIAEREPIY